MTVFGGNKTMVSDVNSVETSLNNFIASRPGLVARGTRTTAKSGITTEAGYVRLDDIPVLAGFGYSITTSNMTLDSTVDGEIGIARIRVVQAATTGTVATTASDQIASMRDYQDANNNAAITPLIGYYFPSTNGYLSVIITAQRVTSLGTFQVFASASEPFHVVVHCEGEDTGNLAVSL